MIAATDLPSLEELYDLIESVPAYPVSARNLTQLAISEGSGRRVIDFYGAFPADQIFYDADDLVGRSEALEIINQEEQPYEELQGPQD